MNGFQIWNTVCNTRLHFILSLAVKEDESALFLCRKDSCCRLYFFWRAAISLKSVFVELQRVFLFHLIFLLWKTTTTTKKPKIIINNTINNERWLFYLFKCFEIAYLKRYIGNEWYILKIIIFLFNEHYYHIKHCEQWELSNVTNCIRIWNIVFICIDILYIFNKYTCLISRLPNVNKIQNSSSEWKTTHNHMKN